MGVIAKQSIQGTVVNYIGVFIGFITTFFVLTRFLSAEEIGLTRVLIDAATLFIGLAQMGTTSSIIRFYPYFKDPEHQDHGFFFFTVVVPLVGFVIFALLWWALKVPIGNLFAEKSPLFVDYYYFVLPLAFFLLYQTVFETNANVLMHIVVPKAVREIGVRVGMLVAYLLYAFGVVSMDGFVVVICGVYGVAALLNIGYLFHLGHISFKPDFRFLDRQLVRQWLFYTLFLLVTAFVTTLGPSLSNFFVTAQLGLDQTGVYAIATYIAVIVSIPARSVGAIAQPELAQASKEQDTGHINRLLQQSASTLLAVGLLLLLLIWLNMDLIFHLLPNGQTYATGKGVVLLLGFGQLVQATFYLLPAALNYSRYYAFSLLFSAILMVSALVLNTYLVPILGINGAATATLLSYVLYETALLIALRFKIKVSPMSWKLLKLLVLGIVGFGLNAVWLWLTPDWNLWLSSILRTLVLGGGTAVGAYYWQVAPEINQMLQNTIRKIRKH